METPKGADFCAHFRQASVGRRADPPWAILSWSLPALAALLAKMRAIDLAYHVRAGELSLRTGDLLLVDPFTFTNGGRPWLNQQWAAQLVFAWRIGCSGGQASRSRMPAPWHPDLDSSIGAAGGRKRPRERRRCSPYSGSWLRPDRSPLDRRHWRYLSSPAPGSFWRGVIAGYGVFRFSPRSGPTSTGASSSHPGWSPSPCARTCSNGSILAGPCCCFSPQRGLPSSLRSGAPSGHTPSIWSGTKRSGARSQSGDHHPLFSLSGGPFWGSCRRRGNRRHLQATRDPPHRRRPPARVLRTRGAGSPRHPVVGPRSTSDRGPLVRVTGTRRSRARR